MDQGHQHRHFDQGPDHAGQNLAGAHPPDADAHGGGPPVTLGQADQDQAGAEGRPQAPDQGQENDREPPAV
jgi:hypothetical protein